MAQVTTGCGMRGLRWLHPCCAKRCTANFQEGELSKKSAEFAEMLKQKTSRDKNHFMFNMLWQLNKEVGLNKEGKW